MKRPWDDYIPEADRKVYRVAGFGTHVGLGRRPALLVIDMQYRTVGSSPRPILEAVEEYPTACGEVGWRAVPHVERLIAAFRARELPVMYPCVAPKTSNDTAGFAAKVPGILDVPAHGYEFIAQIAPQPGDVVLPKAHASAFFGTALTSYLFHHKADSLVVAGCTTSGCVRATVVDACQLNLPVLVPEEAVYDRSPVSHAVNLFDMASKYADVMPMSAALEAIAAAAGPRSSEGKR